MEQGELQACDGSASAGGDGNWPVPVEIRVRSLRSKVGWGWRARPFYQVYRLSEGGAGGPEILDGATVMLCLATGPGQRQSERQSHAGLASVRSLRSS